MTNTRMLILLVKSERERESRDDYWYVTNSRDFVLLLGANWVIYITKKMLLNTYLWIKLPEKKNMVKHLYIYVS